MPAGYANAKAATGSAARDARHVQRTWRRRRNHHHWRAAQPRAVGQVACTNGCQVGASVGVVEAAGSSPLSRAQLSRGHLARRAGNALQECEHGRVSRVG